MVYLLCYNIYVRGDKVTYKTYYNSPIGKILLVGKEGKLFGLWFVGQRYYLDNVKEELILKDDEPVLVETKKWLDEYFNGKKPSINNLSLQLTGSNFRKIVWRELCNIPYGTITTYKDIAKKVAEKNNKAKMSCRAVGGAISHNPISIIIPCHRVIGVNGNLTGYAAGVDKKVKLLKHEKVDTTKINY